MRALLLLVAVALVAAGVYVAGVVLGWYGVLHGPGTLTQRVIPAEVVTSRAAAEAKAAQAIGGDGKQILFGDLHVHTTYSTDAFLWTLPVMGGEGAHPLADACDFARFCSSLDFWSINDHAEAITPRKWRETKETIRECNAVSGTGAPDVIAFLGWEWTQVGQTAATHYGHKNVVLRNLDDDKVPARVIDSGGFAKATLGNIPLGMRVGPVLYDFKDRQRYYDFDEFAREVSETPRCPAGVDTKELPPDCSESAETPGELFEKLDQWGMESIVIPHGTTWGFYTPPDSSWDKQLTSAEHDPKRQTLIEVYSGHGNSEEFRDWSAVDKAADGSVSCPEPRRDYLPSCWRAGEIMRQRCVNAGRPAADCEALAARTRDLYAQTGQAGKMVVPGETGADWLDAGQCRDCFLPAFNYRPKSSVQYITRAHELRRAGGTEALPLRFHRLERQPQRASGHRLQGVRPRGHDRAARRQESRPGASAHRRARGSRARAAHLRPELGEGDGRVPDRGDRTAELLLAHRRPRRGARREPHARRRLERAPEEGDLRHERRPHPALVRSRESAGRRGPAADGLRDGDERERRASRCAPSAPTSRSPAARSSARAPSHPSGSSTSARASATTRATSAS